jgi:hypothetical protein
MSRSTHQIRSSAVRWVLTSGWSNYEIYHFFQICHFSKISRFSDFSSNFQHSNTWKIFKENFSTKVLEAPFLWFNCAHLQNQEKECLAIVAVQERIVWFSLIEGSPADLSRIFRKTESLHQFWDFGNNLGKLGWWKAKAPSFLLMVPRATVMAASWDYSIHSFFLI